MTPGEIVKEFRDNATVNSADYTAVDAGKTGKVNAMQTFGFGLIFC
jgi:hypothetical protein